MQDNTNYWQEAGEFMKDILPDNFEETIVSHIKEREMSANAAALFRYHCVQQVDFILCIGGMKAKN